ncbi:IGF-like family receptor 1 [Camelus dromedarius]|uniref:IGF-like family receptor 1 n=1 Tax=Camelus dromedarius TaxID=9838 RepID=A0A5N4DSB2_CAMDR|nr:IGF-like family receptor 1 [Camelus dromedarius]
MPQVSLEVNCSFYFKIGACRHGDRCSRLHNKPTFSQTIVLLNLYRNPQNTAQTADGSHCHVSDVEVQEHYDNFFEEVFTELQEKYGEIEEMNVCDNLGDHLVGNVYVKFRREEDAERAVAELNNRWFNGQAVHAELSPVTDFRESCCRQYEMGECTRGGFCNFMHLRPISRNLRRQLYGRGPRRSYNPPLSCPQVTPKVPYRPPGQRILCPYLHCFLLLPWFPGKCGRGAVAGSPVVMAPQNTGSAQMGPPRLLLTTALLLALAVPREASQHCSRLEYWNPDNLCCGSCLQRFGPPPCSDYEFSENCGLNDAGDHVTHPFKECPPGQCNPKSAELCSPCGGGVTAPTPAGSHNGNRRRCREKPVPNKEPCPLTPGKPSILGSQEPGSSAIPRLLWTTEQKVPQQAWPILSFALSLVLVLIVTSAMILLLALQRHRSRRHQGKAVQHPNPGLVCSDNTHTLFLHSSSPGSLEDSEAGDSWKEVSLPLLLGKELQSLESLPLSRLLDELEVLEELIVLLDPEPGPGGRMACGTTRHLAARYGLPSAWSTFAYSLRPSRSPLRALIEMMVAREPSASLGQLGTHLAQIGRADALQVLSKLG